MESGPSKAAARRLRSTSREGSSARVRTSFAVEDLALGEPGDERQRPRAAEVLEQDPSRGGEVAVPDGQADGPGQDVGEAGSSRRPPPRAWPACS